MVLKQFVKDLSKREIVFISVTAIAVIAVGAYGWHISNKNEEARNSISSFAECAAAGHPIMESYPEQCAANGQSWSNPNQTAPGAPESTQPQSGSTETDEAAILTSLISYCTANGAADIEAITTVVKANMQDPNLYLKEGGYARIAATCGDTGFRAFLLKTEDPGNLWKLIGMTQEDTLACTALDGLGFPAGIASQCYDQNGDLRAVQ